MKYLPWVLAGLGRWLIAAPFLLGYASTEGAKNNDVIRAIGSREG